MNGNLVGFGIVIISAIVITLPGYLLKLPNAPVMIGVGAVLIAADLVVRLANRNQEKWLMGSKTGGYLFFIPVWVFGIAMIVLNVVNVLFVKS